MVFDWDNCTISWIGQGLDSVVLRAIWVFRLNSNPWQSSASGYGNWITIYKNWAQTWNTSTQPSETSTDGTNWTPTHTEILSPNEITDNHFVNLQGMNVSNGNYSNWTATVNITWPQINWRTLTNFICRGYEGNIHINGYDSTSSWNSCTITGLGNDRSSVNIKAIWTYELNSNTAQKSDTENYQSVNIQNATFSSNANSPTTDTPTWSNAVSVNEMNNTQSRLSSVTADNGSVIVAPNIENFQGWNFIYYKVKYQRSSSNSWSEKTVNSSNSTTVSFNWESSIIVKIKAYYEDNSWASVSLQYSNSINKTNPDYNEPEPEPEPQYDNPNEEYRHETCTSKSTINAAYYEILDRTPDPGWGWNRCRHIEDDEPSVTETNLYMEMYNGAINAWWADATNAQIWFDNL